MKASGKHLFDASVYQTDESTSSFHDMVRELSEKTAAAQPTEFHHLIARLASEGRLMRLYTQNVDGLDTSLAPLETTCPLSHKGPWPRTVQLHGGLQKMVCTKCNHISNFEPELFRGSTPPSCPICIEADKVRTDHAGKRSHGIGKLRPKMLLYNEFNPEEEAIGTVMSADLRARPDAVIVVGTTVKVPGLKRIVREMCGVVRGRKDGVAIWISREPPPVGKEFENCWDLIVEGDSDKVAAHANLKRWDDNSEDYKECSESDSERAKANDSKVKVIINPPIQRIEEHASAVQVIVESPAKKAVAAAMLTPAPSPRSKSIEPAIQVKIFPHLKGFGKNESKKASKPTKPNQPIKASAKPIGSKNKITNPSTLKLAKSRKLTIPKLPNAKIDTAFKVSKPQQPHKPSKVTPSKRKLKEMVLNEDDAHHSSRPMAPISPSAVRNNRPLLPPKAQKSPQQFYTSSLPQGDNPIEISIKDTEVSENKLQSPTKNATVTLRSPSIHASPQFMTTQNSPSLPFYEKLSPTFVPMQDSPSRPFYEKLVFPGDPNYPMDRPPYPDVRVQDSAQILEQEVKSPARLLFPNTTSHLERQAQRPLPNELVIDPIPSWETRGRLKRMSEEIVSPTTIPESMRSLLN